MSNFERLVELMSRLRAPDGCPWDQKQTHQTLSPYLIEEAYEVLEAIDRGEDDAFCEELGDLLLQVVFHAQIAREENRFSVDDVAKAIADKLVRRHPHVFGTVQVENADEVVQNWEAIKAKEKGHKGRDPSVLEGVPRHLPALLRAQRIQEKAARVGFDWDQIDDVAAKVHEEVTEFLEACSANNQQHLQEEFGDLLFSLVNLARFLDLSPEDALAQTIDKFQNRFAYIESKLQKTGKTPQEASLEEMDAYWEEAKEKR
ncbi:MAG: nucleoside triphosphate pyrophosphohydrolase [bacterium]|nr:nucleoside triphosphate pyrophosphohydrolase [bacterium]